MKQKIKIALIVAALLASGVVFSCGKSEKLSLGEDSELNLELDNEKPTEESEEAEPVESPEDEGYQVGLGDILPETSMALVYVCGAVNKPDVYELDSAARVIDAIKAAGGFSPQAAEDYHNLAAAISDGMKIYVPTVEEVEEGYSEILEAGELPGTSTGYSAGHTKNGKININTADTAELKELNGIGDKRAQDIIDYRESHGRFKKIEDIMLVPGIKNGIFSKICNDIEV